MSVSAVGRHLGRAVGRMAIQNTSSLSRISESGESVASSATLAGGSTGGASRAGAGEGARTSRAGGAAHTSRAGGEHDVVARARDACKQVAESKAAVACIVFLVTFVLLCAVNPPMAQRRLDPEHPDHRSWKKITGWSLAAALLVLCLPLAAKFVKKSK
jgi:hypothetical protein